MAERAGSTTVEFAAASHVGALTHYKARFVKLIEQAIKAKRNLIPAVGSMGWLSIDGSGLPHFVGLPGPRMPD
jgi:hypothetical protein